MNKYNLIILILFVAACYLQTLLSQTENKYIGLVIPVISFVSALVFSVKFSLENFNFVKFIFTFVVLNIPTIVFILLYKHSHKSFK